MNTKIKTKTQLTNRLDKAGMPYFVFKISAAEYTYVYCKNKNNTPCLYKFDKDMKILDATMNLPRIKSTYKAFRKEVK